MQLEMDFTAPVLTAPAATLETLCALELADCDNDTLWAQIGRWTKIRADVRDVVTMRDGLMFAFGPRRGNKLHKIVVKLGHDDTYRIERGVYSRRTLGYTVAIQLDGVTCDRLDEIVDDLMGEILA